MPVPLNNSLRLVTPGLENILTLAFYNTPRLFAVKGILGRDEIFGNDRTEKPYTVSDWIGTKSYG